MMDAARDNELMLRGVRGGLTGSARNSYLAGDDGEQRLKAGFIEVIAIDSVFN